jgi:exopolysaccharide biosynthesis polyprenyl glycosylphosphotransferase
VTSLIGALARVSNRRRPETSRSNRGAFAFLTVDSILLVSLLAFLPRAARPDVAAITFAGTLLILQIRAELGRPHRAELSALDEVTSIFRRVSVAYLVGSVLAATLATGPSSASLIISVVAVPTLLIGRGISYTLERSRRRRGRRCRTVIVGGDETADHIATALEAWPEYGLEVVGVVADEEKPGHIEPNSRLLGPVRELTDVVRAHWIDAVIISLESTDSRLRESVRQLVSSGTAVWVLSRSYPQVTDPTSENLWGVPLFPLVPPRPERARWALKRSVDVVGACFGLCLMAPLMALIGVAILIESGRPVLFRQRRVGTHGRHFDILKFRTMTESTDEVSDTEWVADRDRVTRVGRRLRSCGLDELPQFFNVIKGEMSLVGPRPERPFFAEEFSQLYSGYAKRQGAAAGMTGWSQIHVSGEPSIKHRLEADRYYVENWTLAEDLRIMIKTIPSILRKVEPATRVKELPLILELSNSATTLGGDQQVVAPVPLVNPDIEQENVG